RQRVGAVTQVGRLADAVLLHQLQPLRDGVVHRALPAAVRVAAVQAAPRLVLGLRRADAAVQLAPVAGGTQLDRNAPRHLTRQLEELENLLAAHAACLCLRSATCGNPWLGWMASGARVFSRRQVAGVRPRPAPEAGGQRTGHAALRRVSASASMLAAFGFTSQNLPT